jgi:hypothetical protein
VKKNVISTQVFCFVFVGSVRMSNLKEWREELERVNPDEQRMYPHAAMMDLLEAGETAVTLHQLRDPEPHPYELPDMSADLPCAICGRPVRDLVHPD